MRRLRVYGQTFLLTGAPFGVLMGLLVAAMDTDGGGRLVGLVAGAVLGLVMTVVLGTTQLTGFRDAPAEIPLSACQTASLQVTNGPDLADHVVWALQTLPADVTSVDVPAGRYVARRRVTWTSWGEHVVVQLAGDAARPVALVSSRPRLPTAYLDQGRGWRNVRHVVGVLSSRSATAYGPQVGP